MEIIKEKKFYAFAGRDADENVALARLENGAWILIHDGGTANDAAGRLYARVSEEVEAEPMPPDESLLFYCASKDGNRKTTETLPIPDTDLVTLGWTTESEKPLILVRRDGELYIADEDADAPRH